MSEQLVEPPHLGEYDHLNRSDPIDLGGGIKIEDLDAFAKKVVDANYGTHRLLSALIRARRGSEKHKPTHGVDDKLLKGLTELLENGLY